MPAETRSIEVFFSYAQKDEDLRDELAKHLTGLHREGVIEGWYDRNIAAGQEREAEIKNHLQSAGIILLLVSADFLASEYSWGVEVKTALARHEAGTARVIPVILRPSDWQSAPFGKLQALPRNGKAVTTWTNRDEAFLDVVRGIREASASQKIPARPLSSLPVNSSPAGPKVEWGEAPDVDIFYGREKELDLLTAWLIYQQCRVVGIFGIGGIGKTLLASKVARACAESFEYVMWLSLRNVPPISDVLTRCIAFLSDQAEVAAPSNIEDQIARLVYYLRKHRCLLILDNVESIIDEAHHVQAYRAGHEAYGELFRRAGEVAHRSCLVLTSRERPGEIDRLGGIQGPVRTIQLEGIQAADGRQLLKNKGLRGSAVALASLNNQYAGNPLVLQLVAGYIETDWGGDVNRFLKHGRLMYQDVRKVLDEQFMRLSPSEKGIMYWLAIEREVIPRETLSENMVHAIPDEELSEALRSLWRRSLIQKSGERFTLQNVVIEYVTDQLIDQTYREICDGQISLFGNHALIKAQTSDYIRETQVRLILEPLGKRLWETLGARVAESKLQKILADLHDAVHAPPYAAGNLMNLILVMKCSPAAYDFSRLPVRQAYLQGAELQDVNLAHADLQRCLFTSAFDRIISVAYSPDGRLIGAGTANGDVRLWNAETGQPASTYEGHTDLVWSVAFSPDGRLLASGSIDGSVRAWGVGTGQCEILRGHTGQVRSVAFSHDGSILASGGGDQVIYLWEVGTWKLLGRLAGHTNWIAALAFSPNDDFLASGSEDATIRIWDVKAQACARTLTAHTARVRSVAFADDTTLASASGDNTVRLWHVPSETSQIIAGEPAWSVTFSPSGELLAISYHDNVVRLWDVAKGENVQTLRGHTDWIRSMAFSPKGDRLITGSDDQTLRVWNASTGQPIRTLRGYNNLAYAISFMHTKKILASGEEGASIRLWNVDSGKCMRTFRTMANRFRSVTFDPGDHLLAGASENETIELWDVAKGELRRTFRGHRGQVWSVVFNGRGDLLASGSSDYTVRLWNVSLGDGVVLRDHTERIRALAFSPDSTLLASGGFDKTIRLWDVEAIGGIPSGKGGNESVKPVRLLPGHLDTVWSLSFSPDGKTLASCGGAGDRTVRLWNIPSGQAKGTVLEHADAAISVAFSPDGRWLASGGLDRTVRLLDTKSGERRTLAGHTRSVRSVAFSFDGEVLASSSDDETIKLWSPKTGEVIRTLVPERPYERMSISGVKGLTSEQKTSLKALGAKE